MDHLRNLVAGPGQAVGAPDRNPPRVEPPARPFADALFEEGARAGPPRTALARQVATLDRAPRPGMGEHLPPDLDRRGSAPLDPVSDGALSLADLIDVLNPLHHIPVLANLYRGLTGDTISGPARVAGGALYGGPLGMLAGAANAIAAEVNGADPGDTLVAALLGDDGGDIQVAGTAPGAAPDTGPAVAPDPGFAGGLDPTPALAASFAPRNQEPALTGDAALSALLGDLRAGDAVVRPPEADTAAPAPQPLPGAKVAPGLGAGPIPTQGFAEHMLQGLEKYRALAIERGGAGRPATDRLDRDL